MQEKWNKWSDRRMGKTDSEKWNSRNLIVYEKRFYGENNFRNIRKWFYEEKLVKIAITMVRYGQGKLITKDGILRK